MLAYIKLKHNQKAIKQIQKRVAEILSSTTPKTINAECPICLKKIHKHEQKTLECKHAFHTLCIFEWALKNDSKTGKIPFKTPVKNRHIHFLFKIRIYLHAHVVELNIHMMLEQVKLNVFLRQFI